MKLLRIMLYAGAAFLLCTALPNGGLSGFSVGLAAPLRSCGVRLADGIARGADRLTGAEEIKSENENLKRQLSQLGESLREGEEAKQLLLEMEEYSKFSARHGTLCLSIPARISSYIPNDVGRGFILDIGNESGVTEYLPVISDEGLTGIILSASDGSSIVATLLSPKVSACVYAPSSGASGAVCGSGAAPSGMCALKCEDGSFVCDEVLYTSGEGGIFPAGIAVGTVTAGADGILYVKPFSSYGAKTLYYAVL